MSQPATKSILPSSHDGYRPELWSSTHLSSYKLLPLYSPSPQLNPFGNCWCHTVYVQLLMGFIGCSAVRRPSWLSEFSEFSVSGGWLAGWIRWQCQISDINHQTLLLLPPLSVVSPFYSPLLLLCCCLCCRACQHNLLILLPFMLFFHLPALLPLSLLFLKLLPIYGASADSAGFVMNGILLHIRRKCVLHCSFTNCLHCPKNDSLYTAQNGSRPDSQTDQQHSAHRQTSLQSLQTNYTGKTGRGRLSVTDTA